MASTAEQNFSNHTRTMPAFHFVVLPLSLLTFIGSIVNLVESWGDHMRIYSASLIVVLALIVMTMALIARIFAVTAQDRAIRAEENLRHFVLTGKLLDPRLGVYQIVALRFAADDEFIALAIRAAEQKMAPKEIKQAIKHWRPDYHRV
jgi:hypothetical protein